LRFDPRLGTVPRDSWARSFRVEPGASSVTLHGQTLALPKPARELRVLFVGDSATEGAFVPPEANFARRFGALLGSHSGDPLKGSHSGDPLKGSQHGGRSPVTINAGVFGMTTADEYLFLKERLLPLAPDLVVLGLFMSNDLNFNLGHRVWQRDEPSALYAALRTHSALVHGLHLAGLSLSATLGRRAREAGWTKLPVGLVDEYGLHMLDYPAGEVATYVRPPSRLMEQAYRVLEELLASFRALGEQHGFRFAVLLVPSPSAVAGQLTLLHYPDIDAELARQGVTLDRRALDVTLPTRRVLAVCARLGVPCIDPTARMQEHGLRVFFPGDEHPTELGHAVLAAALVAERERLFGTQ
jgi:hypothetical protein